MQTLSNINYLIQYNCNSIKQYLTQALIAQNQTKQPKRKSQRKIVQLVGQIKLLTLMNSLILVYSIKVFILLKDYKFANLFVNVVLDIELIWIL